MRELVKIDVDGVELDGYVSVPSDAQAVVVHFAGLAGNFYESGLVLGLESILSRSTIGFASVNTRGHDYLADVVVDGDDVSRGCAHTLMNEYAADVSSWLRWVSDKFRVPVVVEAHSATACVVAYMAVQMDLNDLCSAAIYLSPADMKVELQYGKSEARFAELQKIARSLLVHEDGALLPADALEGYLLDAAVFSEMVGERSSWSALKWDGRDQSSQVFGAVPSLVTFGSDESSDILDPSRTLEVWRRSSPKLAVDLIDGAGHSYDGHEADLGQVVVKFVTDCLQSLDDRPAN